MQICTLSEVNQWSGPTCEELETQYCRRTAQRRIAKFRSRAVEEKEAAKDGAWDGLHRYGLAEAAR